MTENRKILAALMIGVATGILISLLLEAIMEALTPGENIPTWLVLTQVACIIPLCAIPNYWFTQARKQKDSMEKR